jgi:polyhydroxybutyrate depolymerase
VWALAALVLCLAVPACARLSDDSVDLRVPGVTAHWMSLSGFSDRRALVVAPSSVRPDTPDQPERPLVVVLHGLGSDAEAMARISGWTAAARDHDLVVAFAEGQDHSFDAGGCCGASDAADVDDVAYLRQVISDAEDVFPVDSRRVYLAGYSNGGMMTYRFLCEHADVLAGAASVAGTDTTGCTPSAPVPFLQVSGADDPVVPLAGGPSSAEGIGPFPSVVGSVAAVARALDCPEATVRRSGTVTSTRWVPCRNGVTVGLDVLAGADHAYPLTPAYPATERILQFWGLA